jgi:uncharacterized RDD family membrane protein YckC
LSKSALSKSASLPAELFENQSHESSPRDTGTPAWKQEVNQRLAAHRNRRGGPQDGADARAQESARTASGRAAEAAARVAARYAKAPSYSELLAGEARAVVRAAGAAAEAARNAQAAAQAVLAGLESGPVASGTWEPAPHHAAREMAAQEMPHATPGRWQDEPQQVAAYEAPTESARESSPKARAGAQPRWEETLPVPAAGRDVWSEMRVHPSLEPTHGYRRDEEYRPSYGYPSPYGQGPYGLGSDEGELFPYDAVANATVEPVQHLPANLIEFPRELVATRKARPRLAEGPFYDASHQDSQLSIFEVDPAVLAAPVYLSDTPAVAPPEWASIELDHHPEPEYAENVHHGRAYAQAAAADVVEAMPVDAGVKMTEARGDAIAGQRVDRQREAVEVPQERRAKAVELLVAPMSDRLLAGVVDGALVTLAFLAAAMVVIASTEHPPTGRIALASAGVGLLLFGLLYQFLFLSYAEEGTPGMRYARIALCTFDDDNPSREQMRMRIPALVMSAAPAGLGLIWAMFDGERLGWHDRWTRTYQRKY